MLFDILKDRKCFKLVCGAGNEDAVEVEKLVALYARAGANYFDLSARPEVVDAAYKGLARVVNPEDFGKFYFNVSVGIKGDPHVSKAKVCQDKCIGCGVCVPVCVIQKAIYMESGKASVVRMKCIGCGACAKKCSVGAIDIVSENKPLLDVLPPLVEKGLSSIELHAVSDDEVGIFEQWDAVKKCFTGMLSICIDRSHIGDSQLISRIKKAIEGRTDFSVIVQADGSPMSSTDDNYETTLQALATAHIVQKAKLPVFLMLSGGTNSKTTELAKLFNIDAHGVALGSYARMIVKQYIERDDFFENKEVFNAALRIAEDLVDKSMKHMG